jgi:hypothetical protein
MKPSFVRTVAASSVSLLAFGCAKPLDVEREPVDDGTFGETVLTLVCKRIGYLSDLTDGDDTVDVRGDALRDICRDGLLAPADADAALKALQVKRDDLVAAVDTIFPEAFLPDLQSYLTSNDFLALYDDGTTVTAIDSLIGMLHLFADDATAPEALERLNARVGYLPTTPGLGLVRAVANYPDLNNFLVAVADEVTVGGTARAEWQNLSAALGVTLRAAAAVEDPADPTRTGQLALDMLLTESPYLGTSRTIPLVRRDWRGVAMATNPAEAPFTDGDGDQLADVDAVGRYLGADGELALAPAPFTAPEGSDPVPWLDRDAEGRALSAGGTPLYAYVDLDKTPFAALVRDGIQLFDPQKGTAFDMLRGASALVGDRVQGTRTYDNGESLEYRAYDTASSPLLDMVFGYLQVMRDPNVYDLLALAKELIVNHEPEVARIAEAVIQAARAGDLFPDAVIPAGSPIWDDLLVVIRQILAVPNLARDLMLAMENPAVVQLGDRFRDYMTYKDQFAYNGSQQLTGAFATPVDRAASDTNYNRSLFQRLLHLIHDSNHAVMCNKQGAQIEDPLGLGLPLATYDECDLMRIDNLAVFYVQSIAFAKNGSGQVIYDDGVPRRKATFVFNWDNFLIESIVTDDLLEDMVGIQGFRTHPTPEALNRVLFLDPTPEFLANVVDPARCAENHPFKSHHGGTLPVWEKDGFYDQIRPIVQAFADHNAEQLFVDFLSVLHDHWPSDDSVVQHQTLYPENDNWVWGSNGKSYEPLISQILGQHLLLEALVYTAPVMNDVVAAGKTYPTIAIDAARFLVNPLAGLTNRKGELTSVDSEGEPVTTLSPWQLLADGYAGKKARIVAAPTEGAAWQGAIANLIDVLVRGDNVPTVGWQYRNPRFKGISAALIDFVDARLRAHGSPADRAAWLSTELPGDTERLLTSPVFAGAADFILSLQAAPATRAQLESLLAYLVNEVNYDEAFLTSLTGIADMLQIAVDDADLLPIVHVVGESLRAERGWVDAHLEFVKRARHADVSESLVEMMQNLFVEHRPGHTAVGDLIDGISEVHRDQPYAQLGEHYSAADYRALLRGLADFLDEEKHGLRKFITIIQGRNL